MGFSVFLKKGTKSCFFLKKNRKKGGLFFFLKKKQVFLNPDLHPDFLWKWLWNDPWILFQNLFHCTASHDEVRKKLVSLPLKCRHPGSITDMFQVCHANGYGFASHLGALRIL